MPGFVDIHSHVVPSGDDGAQTVEQGIALCREAARPGTSVLYATPHVWAHLPLTAERERLLLAAFEQVAAGAAPGAAAGLRAGAGALAPARGSRPVRAREARRPLLVEVPFVGSVDVTVAIAERPRRRASSR